MRLAFLLVLFATATVADDGKEYRRDRLARDYGEFIQHFRSKNWDGVCGFVSDQTKAGFGPGEEGCEGVKRVFANDQSCWSEMLVALQQGCKMLDSGGNPSCILPPQFADDDVIYAGARGGFTFDANKDKWMVDALVCGGD